MGRVICPACDVDMKRDDAPDITVDRCPRCDGVFLDSGELDALITGAAGSLEVRLVGSPAGEVSRPARRCPKCADSQMAKAALRGLPDVVLDLCHACGGMYLDRGEAESMDALLQRQSPDPNAQEFRGEKSGHFVRVDRVDWTTLPLVWSSDRIVESACFRIRVYFEHPLPGGLRICERSWSALFDRLSALLHGSAIDTGHAHFDGAFVLRGEKRDEALAALSPEFLECMAALADDAPSLYGSPGQLDVSPRAICYTEGPYETRQLANLVDDSRALVERLVGLAALLEP